MPQSPKSQLAVIYVLLSTLKLNPNNPRIHSKKHIRQIARSLELFGFIVPILVDAALNVIAGHGRAMAALLLGWEKVPVIRLEHLTEAQIRAFTIADNRLNETSVWNEQLLAEQLQILSTSELGFDLEVTGFDMGEIDLRIESLSSAPEEDDPADVVPELGPAISKPGDLWQLGKHRFLCGDALEPANYVLLMDGKKAAIAFCDVPYNVRIDGHTGGLGRMRHREFAMASGEMTQAEYTAFLTRAMRNVAENSDDGSFSYFCQDWRHIQELLEAGSKVYTELKNLCVWVKDAGGMGSLYRSQHELIFVFKNGTAAHRNNIQLGKFGRYRTNVWQYPGARTLSRSGNEGNLLEMHPTVKPVAMVSDAILDCSARGDTVLDPFLGSGTTILAAERTGRVCYGMEIDPLYADTVVRRWQTLTGLTATDEAGQSFRVREEAAHA